tara:strand:+ start:381 stop:848 length:468 start_codon:yes stop_codon:yes gene_type:complete
VTNKYQEAFTRICKAAAYGIGSGDNDVMNPIGYSEEMNQHFKDVETLKEAIAERETWQDISTAPRDGAWFLGLIDGIPYQCKAIYNEGVVNYHWKMHTSISRGDRYTKQINDDGREVRIILEHAEPPNYQPHTMGYILGMNHKPTHWMPLPKSPE